MVPPFFANRATAPKNNQSRARGNVDGQQHLPSSNDRPRRSRVSGLAPLQAPQSARREDGGDGRGHAERDERQNPEKDSTGVGDPAADKSRPLHMEDKDA